MPKRLKVQAISFDHLPPTQESKLKKALKGAFSFGLELGALVVTGLLFGLGFFTANLIVGVIASLVRGY